VRLFARELGLTGKAEGVAKTNKERRWRQSDPYQDRVPKRRRRGRIKIETRDDQKTP